MRNASGVLFAFLLLAGATKGFGQSTPAEIQKMLGEPVRIQDAALFAASHGSFKNFCGTPLEFAGHINMIGRLEFGSLTPPDQETYKSIMLAQYQSNLEIWESLDGSAQKDFCRGLESSLNSRTADFITRHPALFVTKEAPKAAEKPLFTDAVAQKVQPYSKFRRLYIFRLAENRMADDTEVLMKNPDNAKDGYVWALKVSSLKYGLMGQITQPDFADIGALYTERAEIYASFVRGQIDLNALKVAEDANEKKKNDLYQDYVKIWENSDTALTQSETPQLNLMANEVGDMIIGQAKFITAK